jgi:hypothetical protein
VERSHSAVLINRHNRQKWPAGHYLRAKCRQNYNQVAKGLIVWNQPKFSLLKISTNPGLELGRDLIPSCFEVLQANSQVDIIMNFKL